MAEPVKPRTLADLFSDHQFRIANHADRRTLLRRWWATDLPQLAPNLEPEQLDYIQNQTEILFDQYSPEPEAAKQGYMGSGFGASGDTYADLGAGSVSTARMLGAATGGFQGLTKDLPWWANPFLAAGNLPRELTSRLTGIEADKLYAAQQAARVQVDKKLRDAGDVFNAQKSPYAKERDWRRSLAMEGDTSVLGVDTTGEAGDFFQTLDFYADNLDALYSDAVQSAPTMVATGATGGLGVAGGVISSGVMGAAEAHIQAVDNLYQRYKSLGYDDQMADMMARNQMEGTEAGIAAAGVGALGGAISGLGVPRQVSKVASFGGGLPPPLSVQTPKEGLFKKALTPTASVMASVAAEGFGEGLTQLGGNIPLAGLNVLGMDIPAVDPEASLFSGVGAAAAAGAAMGGAFGAVAEAPSVFKRDAVAPMATQATQEQVNLTDVGEALDELTKGTVKVPELDVADIGRAEPITDDVVGVAVGDTVDVDGTAVTVASVDTTQDTPVAVVVDAAGKQDVVTIPKLRAKTIVPHVPVEPVAEADVAPVVPDVTPEVTPVTTEPVAVEQPAVEQANQPAAEQPVSPRDPLYDTAVTVVTAGDTTSVQQVQDALGVGYNRAATLLEGLEQAGVVTPVDAAGMRTVIKQPLTPAGEPNAPTETQATTTPAGTGTSVTPGRADSTGGGIPDGATAATTATQGTNVGTGLAEGTRGSTVAGAEVQRGEAQPGSDQPQAETPIRQTEGKGGQPQPTTMGARPVEAGVRGTAEPSVAGGGGAVQERTGGVPATPGGGKQVGVVPEGALVISTEGLDQKEIAEIGKLSQPEQLKMVKLVKANNNLNSMFGQGKLGDYLTGLRAARDDPRTPVVPTTKTGGHYVADEPDFVQVANELYARQYLVGGTLWQEIIDSDGNSLLSRTLDKYGAVGEYGSASATLDDILTGKAFEAIMRRLNESSDAGVFGSQPKLTNDPIEVQKNDLQRLRETTRATKTQPTYSASRQATFESQREQSYLESAAATPPVRHNAHVKLGDLGDKPTVMQLYDRTLETAIAQNVPHIVAALKKFKPWIGKVNIEITRDTGRDVQGVYYHDRELVQINPDTGANLHTITHEFSHVATVHALTHPTARTSRIREGLTRQMQFALKAFPPGSKNGLSNRWYGLTQPLLKKGVVTRTDLSEFVAEIYTNESFRQEMDRVYLEHNRTLWDKVRDAVFKALRLPPLFTTDSAINLSDMLFETANDLKNNRIINHAALTNQRTGQDLMDYLQGKIQPAVAWTQRLQMLNGLNIIFFFRKRMVDVHADFLKYLIDVAWMQKVDRDYDDIPLHKMHKLASGIAAAELGKWKRTELAVVNELNREMANKYKDKLGDKELIIDAMAHFANLAHVRTATKAVENQLINAVTEAETAIADATKALAQPELIQQYAAAVDLAKAELTRFRIVQDTGDVDPKTDRGFIQGGFTVKQADAMMNHIRSMGFEEKDLRKVQQAYINGYANIRNTLLAMGEYAQEQVDAWELAGLNKDYISFKGYTAKSEFDVGYTDGSEDTVLGASSISPVKDYRRNGRFSVPDNALVNLNRAAAEMAVAIGSHNFRERLYAEALAGNLPGAHVRNTKQGSKNPRPPGVRTVRVRAKNGGYNEVWFEKHYDYVMDGIKGIESEAQYMSGNWAEKATRGLASLLTRFTATFPLVNTVRDVPERLSNLLLRDIRTETGEPIDRTLFATKMLGFAGSGGMLRDVGVLLKDRLRGKEVTYATGWGNTYKELENLGGLTTLQHEFQQLSDSALQEALGAPDVDSLKGLMKRANFTRKQLSELVNVWNELFDVRASLAAYQALVELGVSKEDAAFRIKDVMNFSQRGKWAQPGSIMVMFFPFVNSTFQSAGNLVRSLRQLPTKRGLATLTAFIAFSMTLQTLAMLLAGEDEDDEWLGNKVINTPMATLTGNIPLFLHRVAPGVFSESTRLNVPVGYGLPRIANTASMLTLRKFFARNGDDIDVAGAMMTSVIKEITPFQSEINFVDDPVGWAIGNLSPFMLQPMSSARANINDFGDPIDYAIRNDRPAALQSRLGTAEGYKEIADIIRTTFGYDPSPQQVQQVIEGYAIGPLSGVAYALFGDKPVDLDGKLIVKGRPANTRETLGWWDVVGVSRLYGRTSDPETQMFFNAKDKALEKYKTTYDFSKEDDEYKFPPTDEGRADKRMYERIVSAEKELKKIGTDMGDIYKDALFSLGTSDDVAVSLYGSDALEKVEPELQKLHERRLALMRRFLKQVYE